MTKKYSELFNSYRDLTYTFLWDFLEGKDREAVGELSQMLWVKVFENIEKFENKGHREIIRYMRVMVCNLVNDYHKASNFERANVEYAEEMLIDLVTSDHVERDYFRRYDIDNLKTALRQLDEEEKNLIILFYYDELKSGEIGELLGINGGLVRVRLKRIREKLKKLLEAMEEGSERDD